MKKEREVWIDWLRVIACFLVILKTGNTVFKCSVKLSRGNLNNLNCIAEWEKIKDVTNCNITGRKVSSYAATVL